MVVVVVLVFVTLYSAIVGARVRGVPEDCWLAHWQSRGGRRCCVEGRTCWSLSDLWRDCKLDEQIGVPIGVITHAGRFWHWFNHYIHYLFVAPRRWSVHSSERVRSRQTARSSHQQPVHQRSVQSTQNVLNINLLWIFKNIPEIFKINKIVYKLFVKLTKTCDVIKNCRQTVTVPIKK